jgi:hypothetical protein
MGAGESSLAREIAAMVVAELRAEGFGGVYTSQALPPGCPSRSAFNDRCRFIDAAYRDGKVWVCPVDAYQTAMRRGARPTPRTRKPAQVAFDKTAALAKLAVTPKGKVNRGSSR